MADDIVPKIAWFINSASQGNKRIKRMKDFSVSDGASTESVGEVGSSEHVAFMDKPGGLSVTFQIRETKGVKPEIDWHLLKSTREVFSLTKAPDGARRTQLPECRVSKIDDQGDDGGENSYSVEIAVLRRQRL